MRSPELLLGEKDCSGNVFPLPFPAVLERDRPALSFLHRRGGLYYLKSLTV